MPFRIQFLMACCIIYMARFYMEDKSKQSSKRFVSALKEIDQWIQQNKDRDN